MLLQVYLSINYQRASITNVLLQSPVSVKSKVEATVLIQQTLALEI